MKNFAKLFAVVAAIFAVSCATDVTDDLAVELGRGQSTISVSLEESRTHLGEAADGIYPLYWSEDDAIAVNGVASSALAAAIAPVENAIWRLYPPVSPSRSSTSPAKYNPSTSFDSMLFWDTSCKETPPAVTTHLSYPTYPAIGKLQHLSL